MSLIIFCIYLLIVILTIFYISQSYSFFKNIGAIRGKNNSNFMKKFR